MALKILSRARQGLLNSQLGVRNYIRRRTKRKLFRMLAERKRLIAEGKSTSRINEKIGVFRKNMDNESVHAVAKLWLSPLKDVRAARKIRKELMGKKFPK
ncbi:MAG: hypothetical protein PHD95_02510 [Candidatus ainarchaeum sp.]|nr:hypothetical protein [Candidatus ainarchaeum sp.]